MVANWWWCPIFSLLLLHACCSAHVEPKRECLPSFRSHPARFDRCKTELCVIFRVEKPFVILDPRMKSPQHEEPFRCRVRKNKYSRLRGIFFSTIDQVDALSDAWCIWSGPDCPFDGLIQFVRDTAEKGPHQFLAGGLLFNLEYRMGNTSIPTVPLVHDKILVVGSNVDTSMNISSAWQVVLSPFTKAVWLFILWCLVAMTILRILIAVMFGSDRLFHNIFGEYNDETPIDVRRFNRYWMNGLALFFVIGILYYELALVNFVLGEREKTPIAKLKPENFARIRNTTEEYFFRKLMPTAPPNAGLLVNNIDELYDKLADTKNAYHFTVGYQLFNRYIFQSNTMACRRLQVYDTDERLPTLDGVWFMSSNIPLPTRDKINNEIMVMRETGRMFELIETMVDPKEPDCGSEVGMHIAVIGLPMMVLPGVVFMFLIIFMITKFALNHKRQQRRAAKLAAAAAAAAAEAGDEEENVDMLEKNPKASAEINMAN